MELSLCLALDGARILARGLTRPLRAPYRRYEGSALEICRRIVADRWNGIYFEAGEGHLDQFWVRDLAWCTPDLVRLGYGDQVRATLHWALPLFERAGRVTTTIFRRRCPHDIYTFAADSLPFLLFTLLQTEHTAALECFGPFLTREAQRYRRLILDERSGLAFADRHFSATKDCMRYRCTCYTHTMLAWLKILCARTNGVVADPLPDYDARAVLTRAFWRGDHYRNDAEDGPDGTARDLISADANLWPFWTGVDEDEGRLRASFAALERAGLTSPFPLKYHDRLELARVEPITRAFVPNYQGNAIWTLTGPLYLRQLARIDRAAAVVHTRRYLTEVERYGTYVEVFEPDGSGPLRGRFGHGSAFGMLWAATLLTLAADLGLG